MAKQKNKSEPTGEPKLTVKQQRFVEEYCKNGYNASEAARAAGYSEDSAKEIACENLTKPNIRAAIDKRLKALSLSADETLKSISDIARSNLNSYFKIKKVVQVPKVKKPLIKLIEELQAQIEDADKFMARSGITSKEFVKEHEQGQQRRKLEILSLEIEMERNPQAYRIEAGEPELVETAELDLPRLIKDKEAGRIKSINPTEFGLKVEMYAADAALTNLARIHGLFEKDNKQAKPDNNVVIFKLPDNGRG